MTIIKVVQQYHGDPLVFRLELMIPILHRQQHILQQNGLKLLEEKECWDGSTVMYHH